MTSIRWDLFDLAVSTAKRVISDEDAARDAALQALTELGETATAGLVVTRTRSRAKNAARAFSRRPSIVHTDMDQPLEDRSRENTVFDGVARRQEEAQIEAAIGPIQAALLKAKAEGFTNLELARIVGCSEETIRTRVAAAELSRDIAMNLKGL